MYSRAVRPIGTNRSGAPASPVADLAVGAVDRRLGQAVGVDQACSGPQRLLKNVAFSFLQGSELTITDAHEVERLPEAGDVVEEQRRHRRDELCTVDFSRCMSSYRRGGSMTTVSGQSTSLRPARQRPDVVTREDVEGEARHLQMAGRVGEAVRLLVGVVRAREAAIGDHRALRLAGGTARVDHVRQVVVRR